MSDISTLFDEDKFQAVKTLNEYLIPNYPGLYAIRIKDINKLPEEFPIEFRNELKSRNDTLIYIGKATRSLRERLWEEELHAQRPATFFRSIGAVLGYLPEKGSLAGKRNQNNYKFLPDDNRKIVDWIMHNLLVNFVEFKSEDIDFTEKALIQENMPLCNLQNNPRPFVPLSVLRDKCRSIARGYDD